MGHDILIVDDERDICTLIAGILEDEGYTARRAHNSTEAIDAVRQRRPALVILDVWLQGSELDGLQLLEVIRREEPPVPVVMISGHGTIETAVSAIKTGAYDFIEKPFKADRLLLVVDRAIEAARLRRENAELRRRAGRRGDVRRLLGRGRQRAQPDRARGADRQPRADHRPVGRRQGDGGAADPPGLQAGGRPVRRGELRGHAGRAPGARAVRHRRRESTADALRVSGAFEHGAWRHAAAQGGRRHAAGDSEQAGARAAGAVLHARRRHHRVEVDVRVLASTDARPAGRDRRRRASARTSSTG